MELNSYLPIGSVVLLEGADKRVMIDGRRVIKDKKEYDYRGCFYPEGVTGEGEGVVFDNSDISMIYFIGFQDIEELAFREMVLNDGHFKDSKE